MMKIPKWLNRPDMSAQERKSMKAWIQSKRDALKDSPTFADINDAITGAVKMEKEDENSSPSVWKEPKDVGDKFAVIHFKHRENASVAGYDEVVDEQKIYDIATGNKRNKGGGDIEEIEEV